MIIVCHLAASRPERIVWLLEALGRPDGIERCDRRPDRFARGELRAFCPPGEAPATRDGDVVLAESGAMVSSILTPHGGGGLPPAPGDADFPGYLFWLRASEGSLGARSLREMMIDRLMPDADAHLGMARVRQATRDQLALVEETLGHGLYIPGDRFTEADIMMPFWVTTALRFRSLDLAPCPNARASMVRIGERPAYRRAMALAGPDVTG